MRFRFRVVRISRVIDRDRFAIDHQPNLPRGDLVVHPVRGRVPRGLVRAPTAAAGRVSDGDVRRAAKRERRRGVRIDPRVRALRRRLDQRRGPRARRRARAAMRTAPGEARRVPRAAAGHAPSPRALGGSGETCRAHRSSARTAAEVSRPIPSCIAL